MEERYERRRQGQSTKPTKNQKQHMARHAVSISHICCRKKVESLALVGKWLVTVVGSNLPRSNYTSIFNFWSSLELGAMFKDSIVAYCMQELNKQPSNYQPYYPRVAQSCFWRFPFLKSSAPTLIKHT